MIDWTDHEPHKHASLSEPLKVICKCGWKSTRGKGYGMDQYRAHISSLLPKREEIKTTTLEKKVSANHSTRRRWK